MKILQDSPCWDGSILSRGDEVSLLRKYLQDFAPGKHISPEPFMISGALISSTGLEKVAAIALFRYSTSCPLDFRNGWELLPLFPIYPYPTGTLHSHLVLLAAVTSQSLLWPCRSQTILFFKFCSGFWVHTQKASAHSAASSGTLSSSSHHKALWILKPWLINNAFQQNINPFPPISYNYSLK